MSINKFTTKNNYLNHLSLFPRFAKIALFLTSKSLKNELRPLAYAIIYFKISKSPSF